MTTTAIIFIATSFFITVCGIVYLFWRVGSDVAKWERDNFDDNGFREDEELTYCQLCGHKLTAVRPGSHQCDNIKCITNLD